MVDISIIDPRYNPTMLFALIFFWGGPTNIFQFPCGMLMPTLFDVAPITGLNPLGYTFNPTLETTNEFTIERFNFKNFILKTKIKKMLNSLTRST